MVELIFLHQQTNLARQAEGASLQLRLMEKDL